MSINCQIKLRVATSTHKLLVKLAQKKNRSLNTQINFMLAREVKLLYDINLPQPREGRITKKRESSFSGVWVQRFPSVLFRDQLFAVRDREGVSINLFLNTLLCLALGRSGSGG